ncbi:MAG: biotin--[acetyl-CoA-carboxylase] ligase [Pyrinomonadaceae bacterium]
MFDPEIRRFESIDSTNLEAIRQAKAGAAEGVCVIARTQTAGRGRLDRKWHSPKDAGLYFSVILRPKLEKNVWPLITLMAALAVSDSIMKACAVETDIKWPNDICANDRKICGILAETVETHSGAAAVLGIGINLTADRLAEIPAEATAIELVAGGQVDPEIILEQLLRSIGDGYELLQTVEGPEHIIREWCAHSSYAFDRLVSVSLEGDSFQGVTRGLESDGALRVETADGKIKVIRAGDVTALRLLS